jgi:GntR family transcriptional regulator
MNEKIRQLPTLEGSEYKPLYVQLCDAIRSYIKNNYLKPGDPLPSESELIQHYALSRMTVRTAFQRLVTDGLIHKVQGKGTFVAQSRLQDNILEINSLEKKLSEKGIGVTNELITAQTRHPAEFYLTELGLPSGSKTYQIMRVKKIDNKPFCREVRHLPLDIADLYSRQELTETPTVELLDRMPETKIRKVKYTIRSSILLEMEAEWLKAQVDTPVLIQFSTYYNPDNRPIATGKLTFLADKVDIQFWLKENGQADKQLLIK